MKKNTFKRVLAGSLALLTVAAYAPANVGGFLTGSTNAIVASAAYTTFDSAYQQSDGILKIDANTAPYVTGIYKISIDGAKARYHKVSGDNSSAMLQALNASTEYVLRTTAKVTDSSDNGKTADTNLELQTTDLNGESLDQTIDENGQLINDGATYEYRIKTVATNANLIVTALKTNFNFAGTYQNVVLKQQDNEIIITKDQTVYPIVVGHPVVLTVTPTGEQTAQNLTIKSDASGTAYGDFGFTPNATVSSQSKDTNGVVTFTFTATGDRNTADEIADVTVGWINYLPTLSLAYDSTSTNITATDIGFNNVVTNAVVGTYAFRYGTENGSSFTHSAMSGSNYVYEEDTNNLTIEDTLTANGYTLVTSEGETFAYDSDTLTYYQVFINEHGNYQLERDGEDQLKVATVSSPASTGGVVEDAAVLTVYKKTNPSATTPQQYVAEHELNGTKTYYEVETTSAGKYALKRTTEGVADPITNFTAADLTDNYTAIKAPKYQPNDNFVAKSVRLDSTDTTYLNGWVDTKYYKQQLGGTFVTTGDGLSRDEVMLLGGEKSATFKAVTTVTADPTVATLDKASYQIETVFTLVRKGITNTSIEFYQSGNETSQGIPVDTGADGAYHINWTGKEITPFVRPNASLALTEGTDYYITGTTTATAPGTYEMQIVPTSDSYNNGKAITVKWAIDDNNRYVTRDNFEATKDDYKLAPDFTLSYRKASTKAIEAEIRKQLDFVGSNDLTVVKYVDVTPETWEDPVNKQNKIRAAGDGYKVFNDGTQDTSQKEALDKAAEAAYVLNKAAEDLANYKGTDASTVAVYGNKALEAAKLVLQLSAEEFDQNKDLSKDGILHILKENDALEPDDKDKDKGDVDAAEKALQTIYKAKKDYDDLTEGDKNVANATTYAAAAIAQAEKIVEIGTRLSGRYLATTLQVDETTTSGITTGYAGFDDPSTAAGTYVALVANVVANDGKTSAMLHEGVKVDLVPVVFTITRTNVEIVPTVTECTFGDDIKLSELYKVIDADTADEEEIGVPWLVEPSLSLKGLTTAGTTVKTSTKELDAGEYTYDVTATLRDTKNYKLSTKKMTTFTVNPRNLDDMNFDTVRIDTEDIRYSGKKTVRVTAADVAKAANKLENPAKFNFDEKLDTTTGKPVMSTTDLLLGGGYTSAKKTEVGKILEVNVLGTGNFTGSAKISWSVGGQTTDAAFATYEAEFDVAKPRIMSKLDLTQFEGEIVEAGFYYSNNGKLTGDPDNDEDQKALKTELRKADNGTDASKNPKNSKVVTFSETAVKKALAGNGVLTAEIANSSLLKQTYEMAYVKFANGEVAYDVVQKNNYYDMVMTAEGALEITKTDIVGTGTNGLTKDKTYVRVDVTRVNKEGYTVKRYGVAYNNNGYFENNNLITEQQNADAWLTLDHESEDKTVKIGELEADELATKRGVYVYFANSVDSTGKVGAKKGYAKAFIQIEDAVGNTGAYYSNLADVTYGGFVLDANGNNTENVDSKLTSQIEFYGNGKYTDGTEQPETPWMRLASATGTKPYAQWWEEKN